MSRDGVSIRVEGRSGGWVKACRAGRRLKPPLQAGGGRWVAIAAGAGISGALAFLFFVNPVEMWFIPPCPSRWLSNLHCPGCGTLRAMHALLNGKVLEALGLNPLYMVVLGVMGAGLVWRGWGRIRGRRMGPMGSAWRPCWIYALAGVVVGFWIVRNLPMVQ